MVIKHKNLTIRNAKVTDAEQLCAWWCDGKIMTQFGLPNGAGCTPEQIRKSLASGVEDPNRHIIELDGKPIGEMNYNNKDGAAEIGIKICVFSERNKGYGTKLLTIFIDTLFRYYGYEKAILDTDLKNERAQHIYEQKLGFRRLGVQLLKPPEQSEEFYASIVNFETNKAEWLTFQNKPLEYTHIRTK